MADPSADERVLYELRAAVGSSDLVSTDVDVLMGYRRDAAELFLDESAGAALAVIGVSSPGHRGPPPTTPS
jgi:hypothetical protein